MDILTVLLTVALIGLAVWLLITFIPMNDPFPRLIIGAGVLIAVVYLLESFGVLPRLHLR